MQLKVSVKIENKVSNGELSGEEAGLFAAFVDTCNQELMTHPVITDNKFCKWFASGAADREIVRHFIIQFSVFSNLFLIAQLLKMINAGSLEGMRASKEILANEIGVIFHKQGVKAEDVEIGAESETVTIKAHIPGEAEKEGAGAYRWLVGELGYGDVVRTVTLPAAIDAGKIEASVENGVLMVTVPKAEEAKPRKIAVIAK